MRKIIVHFFLYLFMEIVLLSWIMPIDRTAVLQFFDKILSALGFDTIHFKLSVINVAMTAEAQLQWQVIMLLLVFFVVLLPMFLSGILIDLYSLIFTNNDTKKYLQNERIKNLDGDKNVVRIVDKFFKILFAATSFVVTAVVPYLKISSPLSIGIVIVSIYISTFLLKLMFYKIIKNQIFKFHRIIKNRKAWK